jgi:hypothetical protein
MPSDAMLIQINRPRPGLWFKNHMPHDNDHAPGTPAPATGHYRLVNLFGTPTQHSVHVRHGEPLPDAARGWGWRLDREGEKDE